MNSYPLHFVVDNTFKMRMKNEDGKSALGNCLEFLLHLCRLVDEQPACFNRLNIHYADAIVPLVEGSAESMLKEYFDSRPKSAEINDSLSHWNKLMDEEIDPDAVFFLLSAFVDDRTVNVFTKATKINLVMDFSGDFTNCSMKVKNSVEIVNTKDLKESAEKIHKHYLNEHLTKMDCGVVFNTQFCDIITENFDLSIDHIKTFGISTNQALETIPVLCSAFVFPTSNIYSISGKDVNNATGYRLLKEILGDEPVHDRKTPEKEQPEVKEEIQDVFVKTEVEEPVETVKKNENKKEESAEESGDEEYTPTKKRGGRKPTKTPSKGTKRKLSVGSEEPSPKRATRSSTRSQTADVVTPVKQEELKEVEEITKSDLSGEQDEKKTEEKGKDEEQDKEKEQEKEKEKEKEKEIKTEVEIADKILLIAFAEERGTGQKFPAILRLRTLSEDDKTYHTEEALHRMHEEEAKAAEEARLKAASILDESPASPSSFDQVPASPDMAPNMSHAIKVIPTTPVAIPTEPVVAQDVDMREFPTPASPHDVDYRKADTDLRVPPVKEIPLETVVDKTVDEKVADADPTGGKAVEDELGQAEHKDEVPKTCILENEDDSVKCNAVDDEKREEVNEEETLEIKVKECKYVEIIVLDIEWEKFIAQVGIIGDDETIAVLTARDQTVVGPEPSHDYTQLTGWYTPEAMQFYVKKMTRALRKLQERTSLFEKEIENMFRMVVHGQSPEFAREFAMLIREEAFGIPRGLEPIAEAAASYFDQLCAVYMFEIEAREHDYGRDRKR